MRRSDRRDRPHDKAQSPLFGRFRLLSRRRVFTVLFRTEFHKIFYIALAPIRRHIPVYELSSFLGAVVVLSLSVYALTHTHSLTDRPWYYVLLA